MPCSNHILVVPNSESTGKTYVIGDVHGEIEAFNEVLSELKPHDTLIVAGDLIDRGGVMDAEAGFVPASKQIMDTILRHANAPAGTMPKIYAIKGNHELDFLNILKAIDLLKIPENCNAGFRIKVGMVLANFFRNGGAWIFNRPDNSPEKNSRFLAFQAYGLQPSHSPEDKDRLILLMESFLSSPDPFAELLPEINTYREYIASLPYVIKVDGEKSVLVAHADLPFSDDEINRRVAEDKGFSHEEIKHITGARVREFGQPGERDHTSRLVIVGHNIIDEPDSSSSTPALPVRSDTNHINLDSGAYFTKGFLRFNVTDDQIDIVGTNISEENQPLLHYGQTEIAAHIRTLAHREDRDEAEGEPGLKRIRL